jgi:hypothetical protein
VPVWLDTTRQLRLRLSTGGILLWSDVPAWRTCSALLHDWQHLHCMLLLMQHHHQLMRLLSWQALLCTCTLPRGCIRDSLC